MRSVVASADASISLKYAHARPQHAPSLLSPRRTFADKAPGESILRSSMTKKVGIKL